MIHLSWMDFVLRYIPEALLIILAGHAVQRKKIKLPNYLISSLILSLLNLIFKALPINAVIPMAMSGVAAILILKYINKIKTFYGIISILICYILLIILEAVNIAILGGVLKLDTNKIFLESTPLIKNLYGLPSLILFALLIIGFYVIRTRKRKNVTD